MKETVCLILHSNMHLNKRRKINNSTIIIILFFKNKMLFCKYSTFEFVISKIEKIGIKILTHSENFEKILFQEKIDPLFFIKQL
jgi:hypothetical protein